MQYAMDFGADRQIPAHVQEQIGRGALFVVNHSGGKDSQAMMLQIARNSKAGREWFDWLPIHDLSESEVFAEIDAGGQAPHWAYKAGMRRLSCCFCIYATPDDLRTAAGLNPGLYRRYVRLERRIGHTLSPSCRPLPEVTGIAIDDGED